MSYHHRPGDIAKLGPLSLATLIEAMNGQGCELTLPTDLISLSEQTSISDICTLEKAHPSSISFFHNRKYRDKLASCQAVACIVSPKDAQLLPQGMIPLVTPHPQWSYACAIDCLYGLDAREVEEMGGMGKIGEMDGQPPKLGQVGKECWIHPTAVVSRTAQLGDGCTIGAHSYIGPDVSLGAGTSVADNCTIIHSTIGANCRIDSGARLGTTGFGFVTHPQLGIRRITHVGRVEIADQVEIGANTCVDRAVLGVTSIGHSTKIDNLVQIGHNTTIGSRCLICGLAGIAGSTVIGDGVTIGGQSGIAGHILVGAGASIAGHSGVISDVAPQATVAGFPATDKATFWRAMSRLLQRD